MKKIFLWFLIVCLKLSGSEPNKDSQALSFLNKPSVVALRASLASGKEGLLKMPQFLLNKEGCQTAADFQNAKNEQEKQRKKAEYNKKIEDAVKQRELAIIEANKTKK